MAELIVGDVLENRYRIEAPIARGGMSTVYRCLDLRLERHVAAKVMDARYIDDPIFRQRFQREARSMAQLSHPCLVGVYDFSSDGDQVFLIMELITGGTLRELLAERGPMPPHAAAAVMHSVLTGLSVAHNAGMVHRDIKPDNVLINSDHQVKLADFGLVRAASASQATSANIIGTVSYLSPEQVSGDDIGPASDVYSAGILLYELLTGTTPFSGDTQIAHAYSRLDRTVPAPSDVIDGIPPLFDALVASATTLSPHDRFTDADEFLTALDDVAAELQLPAFKVPVPANAAAHRASENINGALSATDLLTTDIPRDATELIDDAPGHGLFPHSQYPTTHETSVFPATESATETQIFPHEGLIDAAPPAPNIAPDPYAAAAPAAPETIPPGPVEEPPVERPITNRSKTSFIIWLVLVLVVTASVAIGGWWFGSGRYGEVPQVLGMSQIEATALAQDAGFSTTTSPVYSDDIPADLVAGAIPEVGHRAVKGNEITLLVSQGKPTVPSIPSSHDTAEVRALLEERSLSYSEAPPEYSDDVPEGKVVSLKPEPGTTVRVGSEVAVALSRGPAPVNVPHVAEMSEESARDQLEKLGLKVNITEEFNSEIRGGDAIGTLPEAGTTLPRGTTVTLRISTAVEIPDVRGKSKQEATSELAAAGIRVNSVTRSDAESGNSADEITSIMPPSGSLIDPARTSVDLVLAGEVNVPSVVGKKYSEAKKILEEAGFTVKGTGAKKPSSRVYWQSPTGGRETPGAEIKLRTIGS
ncbi:Stk1 family PASTA domain-containing Ser/Thr kinase [Corynebacterium ulcerans]|uniref:non-specific serine/threonine protein kinase n=1 Tax=Corynebacterium ulcerans TaxID=65058 RepID=A0ABD0BHG6_CORUL|nr:Stk1 family PASTA domain-containing Ser/Thr kinase [Corynebacterium ulcerans]AIU92133.1 Serine/threonine protein kinase [Corynebacterium ulcerans]KPH75132.1 serine/threonine protein kinase [Corynebacterium ulcerans]MBH5298019.1 Stk1 family PASTA domain-containing Ser/Thr kinase [Corynebacterium ulcerans]MBL4943229.1 Stk1 family PASTA domain-containing Ser/Thr kinase [Corynebacterium ulcerans]OIS08060.1 serine/threonine protein kinase [Corynebacterium ulcerans]